VENNPSFLTPGRFSNRQHFDHQRSFPAIVRTARTQNVVTDLVVLQLVAINNLLIMLHLRFRREPAPTLYF